MGSCKKSITKFHIFLLQEERTRTQSWQNKTNANSGKLSPMQESPRAAHIVKTGSLRELFLVTLEKRCNNKINEFASVNGGKQSKAMFTSCIYLSFKSSTKSSCHSHLEWVFPFKLSNHKLFHHSPKMIIFKLTTKISYHTQRHTHTHRHEYLIWTSWNWPWVHL